MAKTIWMVRAGENGYLFDDFQKNHYAAIGWNEIGDLKDVTTVEQVRDRYIQHYPGEKPSKLNNAVAMIFKFRAVLARKVIMLLPTIHRTVNILSVRSREATDSIQASRINTFAMLLGWKL